MVSFIGTGISDYADFIIVQKREKVLALVLEYILKKSLWDKIDLRGIQESSSNLEGIKKELRKLDYSLNITSTGNCRINTKLSYNCKRY